MKVKYYTFLTFLFSSVFSYVSAEGEESAPMPEQGIWQTLVMIAIAGLFFYLIILRPEQKRRKAFEDQKNALKKGDRVAAMGIIGTIVNINENTVILKMYDGTKLEFYKAAITEILPETEEKAQSGS